MQRPVSPLLHDYKPSAERRPRKSKALQWFAVGLGIPIAGVALLTGLSRTEPQPPAPETSVMTATEDAPLILPEVSEPVIEEALATPMPPPAPEYDTLTLTVGRGDTMEKMFRRNSLDIGHLMSIARLDEARKRQLEKEKEKQKRRDIAHCRDSWRARASNCAKKNWIKKSRKRTKRSHWAHRK